MPRSLFLRCLSLNCQVPGDVLEAARLSSRHLGPLEGLLKHLGLILGALEGHLERLGAILARFGAPFGGLSWAIWGSFWGHPGDHFGIILG